MTTTVPFTLIDDQHKLEAFRQANKDVDWMGFDTEFMGEKRYHTSICLLQATTRHGNYVIDPFAVSDLSPMLEMISDPGILKITHAGENDYRLLYHQHGILPRNVFDTQIAAGFMHYKYPVAFKRLVEVELRMQMKKSYTVADWETRPFKPQQLEYALLDVLPLHPLWELQRDKLGRIGHLHWAEEECRQLELESSYAKDPNHEALNSQLMRSLNKKEQLFLLRLLEWRRQEAERKNHSREMVLPSKYISHIVKGIRSGKEALLDNRRVPAKLIHDNWPAFRNFSQNEITEEERKVLRRIQDEDGENPREELLLELLYLIIKHHCLEHGVSVNLALPRNALKRIQEEPAYAGELFGKGWRKELFGQQFTQWLEQYQRLNIHFLPEAIALKLDHE